MPGPESKQSDAKTPYGTEVKAPATTPQPQRRPYFGKRCKSVWVTRKEFQSFKDENGEMVSRETAIGLSLESDNPDDTSRDLYEGANAALNILFEKERTNFINLQKMKQNRLDFLGVTPSETTVVEEEHPASEEPSTTAPPKPIHAEMFPINEDDDILF